MMHRYRSILFATSLLLPAVLTAQSGSGNSLGPLDSEIPLPVKTRALGQLDTTALMEVVNHVKAVGTGHWIGMQGTGQIVYGGQDQTAYPATFSTMGGGRFRLDGQTATGQLSIRIIGRTGKVQGSDSKLALLPMETATLGLVQFELPRLMNFPYPNTSLLAKQAVSSDGIVLHRISYEFLSVQTTNTSKTDVTDLYFDANSHLLIKTAALILLPDSQNNKFLQVISYGDYRQVGLSMVPFRYRQTLNGQLQWTLQLTDVKLNPNLDKAFFQF